jgi:hypothetical protein
MAANTHTQTFSLTRIYCTNPQMCEHAGWLYHHFPFIAKPHRQRSGVLNIHESSKLKFKMVNVFYCVPVTSGSSVNAAGLYCHIKYTARECIFMQMHSESACSSRAFIPKLCATLESALSAKCSIFCRVENSLK